MKIFIYILFLCIPFTALSENLVNFDDFNAVNTVRNFEYYVDSTGTLGITQISKTAFHENVANNYSGLFNRYNTWIKLALHPSAVNTPDLTLLIDQANIDSIDLYQQDIAGNWTVIAYGNQYPFGLRKYKVNHFVFDLFNHQQEPVYYLRIRNKVKTTFNVVIGEKNAVLEYENYSTVLFAVLMGIIFAMVAYNLFLYLVIRETVYLVYVIQSFFTGLLQMVLFGPSFQFLWPENMVFQDYGVELLTIVGSISGLIFMNLFLKVKEHASRFYSISNVFVGLYGILGFVLLIDQYFVNLMLLAFQPIIALFILVVAIRVIMKGYKPAKYYLIAWITFLLGIMIFVLAEVGILERNFFTTLTMSFGAGLEVVLLSFALANRINILKTEQEIAVANSYRLEKEKAAIVQEQNILLEQKVIERTSQLKKTNLKLEDKNQEIENAYSDLKNAQSHLVNAEKMSSLGQLTAGIAHEINNPINFVSSNVAPLKRDVEDIIGLFEQTESIAKLGLNEAEFERIQELKEEADYDYLKEEIENLLEGMRDGANRTVEIIQGLKVFSRLDEDDLKKVDLVIGLQSTLVLLNSSTKHEMVVTTDFQEIPLVDCFGGKMNQVFMNILSNGIQAIKSTGREDGEIKVGTKVENENVIVSISDNGGGMTEEVKNKLFDPFFTTKPVGEGTGLGLSIAYKIIDKINGTIQVNSELNKGTEFIITLPITNKPKAPHND